MAGEPSTLRAALRLALYGLRSRSGAAPAAPVPRRRIALERQGIQLDAKRLASYLRATAGGPARFRSDASLPPTCASLWETALALELLATGQVPFPSGGLIHLEGERVQLRPLLPGDQVRCRVELDRVETHPQGLRLSLVSRNWNAAGQLCLQDSTLLLARGRAVERAVEPTVPDAPDDVLDAGRAAAAGDRARPEDPTPAADPVPAAEWAEVEAWSLRSGQGRRYALVSGDFNPVHLWAWSSRPFGYRRPILHGSCTEAMVAHALTARLLAGDPGALRRLRISFRAPLLLPARVRLLVAPHPAGGGGRFRVVGEDEGERPFAEGEYVGSPPPPAD